MDRNFFKRYVFNKVGLILSVVIILLSAAGFLISTYKIDIAGLENSDIQPEKIVMYEVVKDVTTVVFSTFGVNLLLGLCIEKKNKNSAFEDFFKDDIIKTHDFYKRLSVDDKEKMLKGLELNHYYNGNDTLREMCKHSREKIIKVNEEYFYESCEYNVTVMDKGTYFEKDIVRSFSVKSYDAKKTIPKFRLATVTNNKIEGLNVCEIVSIVKDGKDITSKCKTEEQDVPSNGASAPLNKCSAIYYNDRLHLTNGKSPDFIIRMITRCPKDDITSTFRVSVPCKNFSIKYNMAVGNREKYKLVTHSFGCCEDAEDFSTERHPGSASIKFKNLIFKDDGAVVVMCQQNNS